MNAASVRKWCTKFTNGRTDVHDAEKSGLTFVITDALKQTLNCIIRQNRHFTISEVYEQCPEVSRTIVYKIVTEHLQYHKICARWLASKPVSRYVKCLNVKVTMWRSRGRCIFCFFPIINKYLCTAKRSLLSELLPYVVRVGKIRIMFVRGAVSVTGLAHILWSLHQISVIVTGRAVEES